eukprot:3376521-Amphidinium_carterae.1
MSWPRRDSSYNDAWNLDSRRKIHHPNESSVWGSRPLSSRTATWKVRREVFSAAVAVLRSQNYLSSGDAWGFVMGSRVLFLTRLPFLELSFALGIIAGLVCSILPLKVCIRFTIVPCGHGNASACHAMTSGVFL